MIEGEGAAAAFLLGAMIEVLSRETCCVDTVWASICLLVLDDRLVRIRFEERGKTDDKG
jgi:hypothetical protein